MRVIDAMVEILKREGAEFLSCYPTTPIIDAAAEAELRPIVCRQERVGVAGFEPATTEPYADAVKGGKPLLPF